MTLPAREAVLDLLEEYPRGLSLHEIAEQLGVPPGRRRALLGLLDSLVFDGQLHGLHGDVFGLPPKKKPEPVRARGPMPSTVLPGKGLRQDRQDRQEPTMPGFSVAGDPSSRSSKGKSGGPESFSRGAKPVPQERAKEPVKKGLPWNTIQTPASAAAARPRAASGDLRTGLVSVNARGFGFVSAPEFAGDDIFIPAESLGGAMHGDRVDVRIVGRSSRGAEGVVLAIAQRSAMRIAGILRRSKAGRAAAWVEPEDTRVRGPIVLTGIDALGAEGNSGDDGDLCVVTITRHPEDPNENPEGKLVAVLGRPGTLAVETQKLLILGNIQETHSDQAIAEAESYGVEVPATLLVGREDLTHIPLPTIDPEDARDHDDAVWVERTKQGGYKAWIAIADVSSYVRPGTALDEEAKVRGCSVYLPERAIPMLPRALSSNLCSLLPDVIRLCLCAEVELDTKGDVTSYRLIRGFMKSAAKLTYGSVARALDLSLVPPQDPKAEAMKEDLKVAYELSRILRGKRLSRGALDFELPEPKIIFDDAKVPTDVKKRSQDPGMKKAYQLIEELMLLGNEIVARYLVERTTPGIFRVHLRPDEAKLARLAAMCTALGVPFDLDETKDPKALSLLLKRFRDLPQASVLNMLLLRSMKQATYEPENQGHFGLASDAYLHFTSPIRRYPDVVVHRAVHHLVQSAKIDRSEQAKEMIADAARMASQAERRAMEVERGVTDLYRAFVMKDRLGETYTGAVTAIVGSGVFVALDDPFVEVLVRSEDLGHEPFEQDDDGLFLVGARSGDRIGLGDLMTVEIREVSLSRHTVYARRLSAEGVVLGTGGGSRTPKRRVPFAAPIEEPGRASKGKAAKVPSRDPDGKKKARAGARKIEKVVAKNLAKAGKPEAPAKAGKKPSAKAGLKTKGKRPKR
jgi:ribonuclease R